MHHVVAIMEINKVTHNVRSFKIEKPVNYTFIPGQATDVCINRPEWENEKRPFTFTSLMESPYLEFTIKRYADHNGVTNQLHQLKEGDELLIHDVWGAIEYKGPGCFIAGGAGITPFIAILRQLHKDKKLDGNKLIFSNKTAGDIIYGSEFAAMLGENVINVLTDESKKAQPGSPGTVAGKYRYGRINEELLQKEISDFDTHFYVCGPDKMIADINETLVKHGAQADRVIFEK